jgi:hypothetical protein
MELLTKICTKCKVDKLLSAEYFPLHNKTKSGFDSWCKACRAMYRSETRRGTYRSMISDHELKNIVETITECIICGSSEKLVVDHCHTTNQIRGMLCNHCNRGLGHFRDDSALLEFARIYLLSYNKDTSEADEYLEKWNC